MIARKCDVEKRRRLRAFLCRFVALGVNGPAEEKLAPAERFNLVTKIHSLNCDQLKSHFFCLEFDLEYLCAITT